MFASHTLVAYPIASRFGIVRTRAVTTVLGATLITDLLALLVLAVVIGARRGVGFGFWLAMVASLVGLGIVILWLVPRVARWFFRRLSGGDGASEFIFVMVVLFCCCSAARLAHIEPIIGALLTGLALNRFIPHQSALMSRIRFAGSALLVPFFLLSVGMLVNVRAFGRTEAWAAIAALTVSIVLSKGLAAKLTQRMFHYAPEDGWVMFGMSVSHAAATMAIVLVGFDVGLFDGAVLNAVVVIILVTCLVGPWAVNRWGRKLALREEARAVRPGQGVGPHPHPNLAPQEPRRPARPRHAAARSHLRGAAPAAHGGAATTATPTPRWPRRSACSAPRCCARPPPRCRWCRSPAWTRTWPAVSRARWPRPARPRWSSAGTAAAPAPTPPFSAACSTSCSRAARAR